MPTVRLTMKPNRVIEVDPYELDVLLRQHLVVPGSVNESTTPRVSGQEPEPKKTPRGSTRQAATKE